MAHKKSRKVREVFIIRKAAWPDERETLREIGLQLVKIKDQGKGKEAGEGAFLVPPAMVHAMADIATNAWKAKEKMTFGDSGEVRDEMKRVFRHVESILESLREMGLEVKSHTGESFDYGLPLKVVTTQPTQGITKESVIETIKPTIYWQSKIIQMGEVVIATPIEPTTSA
jgi:hypothetical protein